MKIKDNTQIPKDCFSEISKLVAAVADKTLFELANEGIFVFPDIICDSKDLSDDQMVLQSKNGYYCSGNIMGFLGHGDERLAIESRFSNGDSDYLFQYLLERVMDFPNIVDLMTDATINNKMFAMMIFLFPSYLASAMRKGIFKTYIPRQYNNRNIRGTIDVGRHIRLNTPFTGNIAYNQREYTYDNYLIQLIRHTIEYIKRKPYGNRLLSKVKDEVRIIVAATPDYTSNDRTKIIAKNKKIIVRHAYYHEYRSLQQLCMLILQNEKTQIGVGLQKTYGILFDGAWLWEEYMNSLISSDFYHPMNKQGKDAQWLFAHRTGKIYPDFIGKSTYNRYIADAKYKPAENIGNKDYFQMLAYMFRFDANRAYLLYPDTENASHIVLYLNRGSTYEHNVMARDDICVIKHGLQIPHDAESYDDFVNKIRISENLFTEEINRMTNTNKA